jgi:hemolysin activation/secretion protein
MSFSLECYIPIYNRNILKLSNKSDFYYAPEVFQNELFRFGGLQTLRGFNEEEIFASSKSVFSIEYRFLLDKNSNVFAFYDQGIYENNSLTYRKDKPFGFGAGLSFGTNLGIFSISLAIGKQLENPILLRNSKVHFGYIAYF